MINLIALVFVALLSACTTTEDVKPDAGPLPVCTLAGCPKDLICHADLLCECTLSDGQTIECRLEPLDAGVAQEVEP